MLDLADTGGVIGRMRFRGGIEKGEIPGEEGLVFLSTSPLTTQYCLTGPEFVGKLPATTSY